MGKTASPNAVKSWDDARRASGLCEDVCPADAQTVSEYGRKYGLTRFTAQRELQKMVAAGKVKTGRAYRVVGDRKRTLVQVYWLA